MLIPSSLSEQVYEYLKNQMISGQLTPGSNINIDRLSQELGVSKTPLRDAFIRLESEKFIVMIPHRGVMVRQVTHQEIKDLYQIIGALEATVLQEVFPLLNQGHVDQMKAFNLAQTQALEKDEFGRYYQLNLDFHEIFLGLSVNLTLRQMVTPLKQRLYDFPRQQYWKEWEMVNMDEHRRFFQCIEEGDVSGAIEIWKNEHWGWSKHEPYFIKFYGFEKTE